MKKIYLYSPIPPMRTGTADYFDTIVKELACHAIDRKSVEIVVDDAFLSEPISEFLGFAVKSVHAISNVILTDEIRVYFLANNEYHTYAYRALFDSRKMPGAKSIAVVHEPCCFMLFNNVCSNRVLGFDDNQLELFGTVQFGGRASSVIAQRRSEQLPFEAEFWMHFQYIPLTMCDEIWTHNLFSSLKLILESEPDHFPKIVVSEHPDLMQIGDQAHELPPQFRKRQGVLRLGIFGWIAPSKRVDAVIRAFALAMQTMPTRSRELFELVIVGQLPPKDHYDPAGLAKELEIDDLVHFWNYVPLRDFEALLRTCDLLFGLRFPSCGESSGTWQRAYANAIPMVATAYQGFREIPAVCHVSSFAPDELASIYSLLTSLMRGEKVPEWNYETPKRLGVSDLLVRMLLR